MLDIILDYIKRLLKSRLFPIALIYLALFAIIINRLFTIQIVQGPENSSKSGTKFVEKRELKSTRGNIYDRKGKLLATNTLSYSITLEDSTRIETNEQRNKIIYHLIEIIEENGDTLDTEFGIRLDKNGKLEFTTSDEAAILRFKKNAYTYDLDKNNQLFKEQKKATAKQVYDFLKNGTSKVPMFGISDQYSVEDSLKIMSVRYALLINYPKYLQLTIASNVKDTTVAAVKENSTELLGVEVQQQTKRVYNDSIYFAHILGYTGKINAQELTDYNGKTDYYNSNDIIGKTGLEKQYEKYLRGNKGSETIAVSHPSKKVIKVVDHVDPIAGNDVYLTLDSDLQKVAYHVLEKEIAGILLSKIRPDLNYGTKGKSASKITIPIYEVYNALLSNNVIDINHFTADDATPLEKRVYSKFKGRMNSVFNKLDTFLAVDYKIPNDKTDKMEDYLNYFSQVLMNQNILVRTSIPKDDPTYKSYQNNTISLSSFLQYAIANNWIDLSKLGIGNEYYNSEELYSKLINYTKDKILKDDRTFKKKIYRDLVFSYNLTGNEICLLLFDQDVLKYKEDEINGLKSGRISAYNFIKDKLISLEITPGMLALDPCSGSLVVTDVNTGDVLALVTYPCFDNNKLANKMDANYYYKIHDDKAYPWMDRPVSQLIAPGSTFKMVTSFAALQEGVIGPTDKVNDLREYKKIKPSPKCHIYPGSHGLVDLPEALKVSCNYFFYEMGWRLSRDSSGNFNEQLGLKKIKKYATMFGLNKTTGIELYEAKPQISNKDSVRSAIGQGSNNFTPIQLSKYVTALANKGTCYNLTLLDKIVKDGKTILKNKAAVSNKIENVKDTTWNSVHQGMYNVVNARGGSVYNLYNNLGVTVAGKTGTSQINTITPNNALFVSYAPYEKPEISLTAVIPNGYTSSNAAEAAREVYKYYFKLETAEKIFKSKVKLPASAGSIE